MGHDLMIQEIANDTEVTESDAMLVIEEFLLRLHKMEYENTRYVDFVSEIRSQLSDRALFHLLGFFEEFSTQREWERGDINEYLGRMPPCERWQEIGAVMDKWENPTQ